jgi:Cu(I)/Ag(I) efflux system membrane fusion protein
MRRALIATCAAVTLVACGRKAKPSSEGMAGMAPSASDSGPPSGREPVYLTAAQAGAIGVTYAAVERGTLSRLIRTVGQITPAESRQADVTAKIDGFVDRLYVDATGLPVRRGQPLLDLYSPMLVAAQEELLTAKRLAASVDSGAGDAWRNAQNLRDAARRRLAYWDISADQIDRLEQTGAVTKTLTLRAPFDGVVLEKMVVTGQSVGAGMKLYRLADLSTVWIEGDAFEQDLGLIHNGTAVRIELEAFPGRTFGGRVSFVGPVVDPQSRAGRVRVEVANRAGLLKPGMYATLFFDARLAGGADLLSVPAEAVVMTGERNLVFVVTADGALQPREVTLGARAGERFQVLRGLTAGERVVASANFLVDAESRLGAGKGMGAMPGMSMDTGRPRP